MSDGGGAIKRNGEALKGDVETFMNDGKAVKGGGEALKVMRRR